MQYTKNNIFIIVIFLSFIAFAHINTFSSINLTTSDITTNEFPSSNQNVIENNNNIQFNNGKSNNQILQKSIDRLVLIEKADQNNNGIQDNFEKDITNSNKMTNIIVIQNNINNLPFNPSSLFQTFNGHLTHQWKNLGILAGNIPENEIFKLADYGKTHGIGLIEPDRPMITLSDHSISQTNVNPIVWSTLGYEGDPNASIAILDTGFDASHPIIGPYIDKDFTNAHMVGWYDATVDGSSSPEDYGGHGTHVAGIALGNPYNDSNSNDNIKTTWSTTAELPTTYTSTVGYYKYINISSSGEINLTYYWRQTGTGGGTTQGKGIWMYDPNGTLVASDTIGSGNYFSITYNNSANELGLYKIFLGFVYGNTNHKLDIVLYGSYPYDTSLLTVGARFSGVAPKTKLVGVKVFDNTGSGTSTDLINGINWVINNKNIYHIVAASMSLGFPCSSSGCQSGDVVPSVEIATASLINNGIITLVAAGNDGHTGPNMIGSPANVDNAITVASTGDYHEIAGYSSEGPGYGSNTTKPDLSAPGGENIQGGILQADTNFNDIEGTGHGIINDFQSNDLTFIQGTSMATPHVAGIADLLEQALGGYINWNYTKSEVLKVKQILLMSTWATYGADRGIKNNVEGWGEIQADAAIGIISYPNYEINSSVNGFLTDNNLGIKVWGRGVNLIAGKTYSFNMNLSTSLDADLYLFNKDPNQYGDPEIISIGKTDGQGLSEYISFTPKTNGKYYLVIKEYSGSGNFTLKSQSDDSLSPNPIININDPLMESIKQGTFTVSVNTNFNNSIVSVSGKFSDSFQFYPFSSVPNTNSYQFVLNTSQFISSTYHSVIIKVQLFDGFNIYNNSYFTINNLSKHVLLVDDDNGATYEDYYIPSLNRLKINYTLFTVPANANGPSATTMNNYDAVIWFTGDESSNTLTLTDQNELTNYLNNGGNLFVSGQDIGYDIGGTTFYSQYLHANFLADSGGNNYIIGQNYFSGLNFSLNYKYSSMNNIFPDSLSAINNGIIELNYYPNVGGAVGYNGGYSTLYLGFPFESISSSLMRINMMRLALEFINILPNNTLLTNISLTTNKLNIITNNIVNLSWQSITQPNYVQIFIDNKNTGFYTNNSIELPFSNGIHDIRLLAYLAGYKEIVHIGVFVEKPVAPIINSYGNKTFAENDPQKVIIWKVIDDNPSSYIVYLNGTSYTSGNWLSGVNISIVLPNSVGYFNLTLVVYDNHGLSSQNTIFVTITNLPEAPSLQIPNDQIILLESEPVTLTWNATDLNPNNYTIYRNDQIIDQGDWISGVNNQLIITGLIEGSYNFTITVTNSYGLALTKSFFITIQKSGFTTSLSQTTISYPSSNQPNNTQKISQSSTRDTISTTDLNLFFILLGISFLFFKRKKTRK